LGKSSSEAPGRDGDQTDLTVKLDFGLSHSMLTEEFREAWPYEFGLVYSVTLTKDTLETALQVRNEGKQNFDFQTLMHTYLNIAVGAPLECYVCLISC
jgi:glucose-6-phosphate 1-epimerase